MIKNKPYSDKVINPKEKENYFGMSIKEPNDESNMPSIEDNYHPKIQGGYKVRYKEYR